MRRVIFMMLLATVSSSAMAEWIFAKGNNHVRFYYDPASIVKNGKTTKIWILQDYKKAEKSEDGKRYLSLKALIEFNCGEKLLRGFSIIAFSMKMGKGKIVYEDDYESPETREVPPHSIWESIFKTACGKN